MGKSSKEIFYIEKVPGEVARGLGWIEVDENVAQKYSIPHKYTDTITVINYDSPIDALYTYVYLPKVRRKSNKKFSVQLEQESITLFVQKSLTIKAVREWLKTWTSLQTKLITPDKKILTLDGYRTTESAFVYFIFNIDSQAIKIGMAKNVEKRLKSLQTSSPIILELLHTIQLDSVENAQKLESVLHQKFAHLRMNGEWFKASEELRAYIKYAPASYFQPVNTSKPLPLKSVLLSEL